MDHGRKSSVENKLRLLFEYQQFDANEKLSALIREAETEYERCLSDEELEGIFAAGENPQVNERRRKILDGKQK